MNGLLELIQASIYEGENEWFTRVIESLRGNEWFIGVITVSIYTKGGNNGSS